MWQQQQQQQQQQQAAAAAAAGHQAKTQHTHGRHTLSDSCEAEGGALPALCSGKLRKRQKKCNNEVQPHIISTSQPVCNVAILAITTTNRY